MHRQRNAVLEPGHYPNPNWFYVATKDGKFWVLPEDAHGARPGDTVTVVYEPEDQFAFVEDKERAPW